MGTIRRNLFVPALTYHDIEKFNRSLLDMHEKKAAEPHYEKGIVISELFETLKIFVTFSFALDNTGFLPGRAREYRRTNP